MLRREISPVILLEVIFMFLLIVVVVGFVNSDGARPTTFAVGVALLAFALIACEGVRRQRHGHAQLPPSDVLSPDATNGDEGSQPAEHHAEQMRRYGQRQLLLAAVLAGMVLCFILIDGRPRVAFGSFGIVALISLVNLWRLRHQLHQRTASQTEPDNRSSEA